MTAGKEPYPSPQLVILVRPAFLEIGHWLTDCLVPLPTVEEEESHYFQHLSNKRYIFEPQEKMHSKSDINDFRGQSTWNVKQLICFKIDFPSFDFTVKSSVVQNSAFTAYITRHTRDESMTCEHRHQRSPNLFKNPTIPIITQLVSTWSPPHT